MQTDAVLASWLQQAIAYHQSGRLQEAESLYRQILESNPQHHDALHLLGLIVHQAGDFNTAIGLIRQAISIFPSAQMYSNLGVIFQSMGKFSEAEDCYRQSIALNSQDANTHFNFALALKQQRKLVEAIDYYQRAVALNPNHAQAYYNMGNAYKALGEPQAAIESYQNALAIDPRLVDATINLGLAFEESNQLSHAEQCYRNLLDKVPGNAEMYFNLGNVHAKRGQLTLASSNYETAISLKAEFAKAYCNLGNVQDKQGLRDKAIESYRKAIALKPDFSTAHGNLIFTMDLQPGFDVATLQQERQRWAAMHASRFSNFAPHRNQPTQDRRLRVGYVSADFRHTSALTVFMAMVLEYDRNAFEVFAYSNSVHEDAQTDVIRRQVSAFKKIAHLDDDEVAALIRADQIDILVDLSSHMAGNRLLVFARKPAPVQITAWGYIGGTGMSAMDVLFADEVLVPPEEKPLYAEEVRYLPASVCYCPFEPCPPTNALPALAGSGITFGSFNRLAKVTDDAFSAWIRVLAAVPGSRMVLKSAELDDEASKNRIREMFSSAGIAAERIILLGKTSWVEHIAAFKQVDISLDPFPHGGGVTAIEGLMMGVPVVTLKWPTIPGRISASVLSSLGLQDWIAASVEDYVRIAAEKAGDLAALVDLRMQLRGRIASSPLGDLKAYVHVVEQEYRVLWQRWCQGRQQKA